jgi:hypothetical protein
VFLLATSLAFVADVFKVPTLAGPLGDRVRGQALAGAVAALVAALASTKVLVR